MPININNLPKAELLAALFNEAKIIGATIPPRVPRAVMTPAYAQMMIDNLVERKMPLYFDQIMGRGVQVNLDGDVLDGTMYDRHNGEGAAERVITRLRLERSNLLNISGIPKGEILAALFNAIPTDTSNDQGRKFWMSVSCAAHLAAHLIDTSMAEGRRIQFDKIESCPINIDITTDDFDRRGYNALYGEGAAEGIVKELRKDHP